MLKLYHHTMCPNSRQTRILLKELGVDFELLEFKFWIRNENLLAVNPTGSLPVLFDGGKSYYGKHSLLELIFEEYGNSNNHQLLGDDNQSRYAIRSLHEWFSDKMFQEVTKYLVKEKFVNVVSNDNSPNSSAIIAAKKNLNYHLDYLDYLLKKNQSYYIVGDKITVADIAAVAQISCIDYLGDLKISSHRVQDWYRLLKSRPSIRGVLKDEVPGFKKPVGYGDPDM